LLYLPLLVVASASYWAFELWHARLVFASTACLHALFGLAALLAARAVLPAEPGRWGIAARWAWHGGWLLVLLTFGLAAAGNFLSRSHWGDPLSFVGMRTLLAQDNAVAMARELATPRNLLLAAALPACLLLGAMLFAAAARSRFGLLARGRFAAHPGKLLAGCLALCLFIAWRHPGALAEEPLFAFAGGSSDFWDYQGLAERRAAVRVRDRQSLLGYDPLPRPRKNVVLIMGDSLRADHFPDYGYHRPLTPFLSRLLEDPRTQRAEWAFSTCSESGCGIGSALSGHPYQDLSHGVAKIYEYLAQAGYDNDLVLTGDHSSFFRLDRFYGDLADTDHGREVQRYCLGSDDRGALRYLEQLEDFDGQPKFFFFFLMSSHSLSVRWPEFLRHLPDDSSQARLKWNNEDAAAMLRSLGQPPSYLAEQVVNYYDNGIEQFDHVAGKIFAGLEERGYLDDALYIVTSDHGDSLGEHNHIGHSWRLYNVDIRIPLVIWDSDHTPRPKELPIAAHVSLAPTIFDRLGLPLPATLTAPPLDRAGERFDSVHLTRRPHKPCAAAIAGTRDKLHKLIACKAGGPLKEELYELVGDPHERHDLLAAGTADPAVLAGLRARLDFFYADILRRRPPKKD
jgi:hypothetical protein